MPTMKKLPSMPTGLDNKEMLEHWVLCWTKVDKLLLAFVKWRRFWA